MFNFVGKKVLVTGGSRGIGKEIATLFYQQGGDVTITCTNKSGIDFNNLYADSVIEIDFAKATDEDFKKIGGDYDVVINNAGINEIANIEDFDFETWQNILNVNLTSSFRIVKRCIPNMKKKRWGRIINIGSISSHIAMPQRSAYCASKFGLLGFTKVLSAELAQFGIMCNVVSPGFVKTDLTKRVLGEEKMKLVQDQIPVGRLAEPIEIAKVVMFLTSDWN